jgi:hypothetical protein
MVTLGSNLTTGEFLLRKENVDAAVKGFALASYKMKPLLTISPSSAWKESFYQEGADELTASGTAKLKGIPRLANFPYGEVKWTKIQATIEKYGMEGYISYEDEITNDIDVIARTMLRIGRAIAKAVDDEVYNQLFTNAGNSVTSGVWDTAYASGAAILAINEAIRKIEEKNYDIQSGGALVLSPKDYEGLMNTIYALGAQAPKMGEVVIGTRKFPTIMDLAVIKSNSVLASGALVLKIKDAGTWRSVVDITTDVERNGGIGTRIRGWELGVTQITNPYAISKITGTQTP